MEKLTHLDDYEWPNCVDCGHEPSKHWFDICYSCWTCADVFEIISNHEFHESEDQILACAQCDFETDDFDSDAYPVECPKCSSSYDNENWYKVSGTSNHWVMDIS